jgi:hypothetical protein
VTFVCTVCGREYGVEDLVDELDEVTVERLGHLPCDRI